MVKCMGSVRRFGISFRVFNSSERSKHVLFCLLYKHTNDDVFDDFPKISDQVLKFSEDFPKLFRRPDERFRTFSKDNRVLSKITELTTKEDP